MTMMTEHPFSLDRLFQLDAILSLSFGVVALLAPHALVSRVVGGAYHHATHETLRLYACLRIACGWILWHVRTVDDGYFRRHVCEALVCCYSLQALTVLRAESTSTTHYSVQVLAAVLLLLLAAAYGRFRFGNKGHLIKLYELPTGANRQ